ncbi:hypothetical protein J6A32_10365 [Methanocorpusculum sp.]|nr:hypothetical protein [Methanocorpusculum sp.]
MTGLGLIGTGAAFVNYQHAKSQYDTLAEKKAGLSSAIAAYNPVQKYLDEQAAAYQQQVLDEQIKELDRKANVYPEGLKWSVVLRVGNLVGKLFRAQPTLTMTNTGNTPIFIVDVNVECKLLDLPVLLYSFGKNPEQKPTVLHVGKWIHAGETMSIDFPKGISSSAEKQGQLRDIICQQAGKKLITSCPKMNVEGDYCRADVRIVWNTEEPNYEGQKASGESAHDYYQRYLETCKSGYTVGAPAVLRYCGEAYL